MRAAGRDPFADVREIGGGVTQQRCPPIAKLEGTRTLQFFKPQRRAFMALKPGPKPIAKSTGKPDQRRRDNKTTEGNTPSLKPSKSSNPPKK